MRTTLVAAAALFCMATASTFAGTLPSGANPAMGARPAGAEPFSTKASNISAFDTHSVIAPRLPQPAVLGDNPGQYLRAARKALATGQTGLAQEALEEAETRLLDRSVPMGDQDVPDHSPAIRRIDDALQALATGNLVEARRLTSGAELAAADHGTASPNEVSSRAGVSVTITDFGS